MFRLTDSVVIRRIMVWLMLLIPGMAARGEIMDLSGEWGFQFDITDFERSFQNAGAHRDPLGDTVQLPGTTDTNKKGIQTTSSPINRLSRLYEYAGPAWYQRQVEIPAEWEGKQIELFLERILWISSLYVDGSLIASQRSFSTPHTYDLSDILTPGRHTLSICVDNRVPPEFDRWSHAFSEYTQTAWNGIAGKIELRACEAVEISSIQAYPDVAKKSVRIECAFKSLSAEGWTGNLAVKARPLGGEKTKEIQRVSIDIAGNQKSATVILPLGENMLLWDEYTPNLYEVSAELTVTQGDKTSADVRTVNVGMRTYGADDHHFTINGRKLFLRGTLECAIFPLTGYADMSLDGWLRICRRVKSYGLNHIRFHSWCPPEAAFVAADQTGIYLQPELPCWTEVGTNPMLNEFFQQEMDRILAAYGNHPSFVQLCMGNELRGDFNYLAGLIDRAKKADPRHLYSGATARQHLPQDDFYVSHVTSAGGITTYGARGPQTDYDLRAAYEVLTVPGVAHETGQRAVYPNFKEISKYTGVLYPRNFVQFQQALSASGMLQQADAFFQVSGHMTAMLYKESIEALLRTPNCGGFQLLDLHDFPGQGTALVGLLDPFWDSKGLITPEQFREFCGPTVPLLRFKKREYTNREIFEAQAQIYHYQNQPLPDMSARWTVTTARGNMVASGELPPRTIPVASLTDLGTLSVPLDTINQPEVLTVTLHAGSEIKNSWQIWVYPADLPAVEGNELIIAHTLDDNTIAALNKGGRVLLLPDLKEVNGKPGSFQNHFWCPIMFRWEPMTMGTLVQQTHPAFKYFPTDYYTQWQWWNIIENSRTLVLTDTPAELTPLLQPIDTYDRCLKQGVIFEAKVASGKLLLAAIDFEKNMGTRPAARQLLHSLKQYATSPGFQPRTELTLSCLEAFFKQPSLLTGAKVMLCDSYEKGNEPALAIDGDPATIWHTAYNSPGTLAITDKSAETDYPHEIQIELAADRPFKGFRYIPRTDGINGYVAQYEFYASADGKTWNTPVAAGRMARNDKPKEILFEKPVLARYIRFVALKGFDQQKWASMAELELIPVK